MSNTAQSLSPRTRVVLNVLLVAALVLVGVGLFANSIRTSQAAPPDKDIAIRYLAVSGDGASARCWYEGAPPAGLPVQTALDQFAKQGYQVKKISQRLSVVNEAVREASVWTLILERVR